MDDLIERVDGVFIMSEDDENEVELEPETVNDFQVLLREFEERIADLPPAYEDICKHSPELEVYPK